MRQAQAECLQWVETGRCRQRQQRVERGHSATVTFGGKLTCAPQSSGYGNDHPRSAPRTSRLFER